MTVSTETTGAPSPRPATCAGQFAARVAELLGAGYEVTFTRDDAGRITCHTIAADGDGITATGATVEEALADATPLAEGPDPDSCTCGHLGAEHTMKPGCVFPCSLCGCADFDAAVPFEAAQ